MCPDTSRIETQKHQASQDVSRYKQNRDTKTVTKQKAVPIQAQPGQLFSVVIKLPLQ